MYNNKQTIFLKPQNVVTEFKVTGEKEQPIYGDTKPYITKINELTEEKEKLIQENKQIHSKLLVGLDEIRSLKDIIKDLNHKQEQDRVTIQQLAEKNENLYPDYDTILERFDILKDIVTNYKNNAEVLDGQQKSRLIFDRITQLKKKGVKYSMRAMCRRYNVSVPTVNRYFKEFESIKQ